MWERLWINLDSVKIGYEISFNKHFYKHELLRSMGRCCTRYCVALERQAQGLIAEILGLHVEVVSGAKND